MAGGAGVVEARAMRVLSPNRFVEAVFAILLLRHKETIPDDGGLDERFNKCLEQVEQFLARQNERMLVPFSFAPDELHGDSPEFRDALLMAGKSGVISIDNPEFRTVRLKLTAESAKQILRDFPVPTGVMEGIVESEFAVGNGLAVGGRRA